MNVEVKQFGGRVVEHKEIEREGQLFGIIEVLLATWEPDTGGMFGVPDRFVQGAFSESLRLHRERDDRQVRMKNMHQHIIGGFPIETVVETSAGLFAIGEINLQTQEGMEVWALVKQGVLVDMSVGFSSLEDEIVEGVLVIRRATLWEGSVVDEPANRNAAILNFKSTPFADLPIAPADHPWDLKAARERVEGWAKTEVIEMKSAFVHEKNAEDESFDLQIADVIDGKMTVVPTALKEAADTLIDREGVDHLVEHLERYFSKMGVPSPFPSHQRKFFGASEVREWKAADVETALTSGVRFSRGAAKVLAARLTNAASPRYDGKAIGKILHDLEEATRTLRESR